MLDNIKQKKLSKEESADQIEQLRSRLWALENKIKENNLPVIITIDGWSASGKGSQIAQLIKCLDPRFYKVMSFGKPNEVERAHQPRSRAAATTAHAASKLLQTANVAAPLPLSSASSTCGKSKSHERISASCGISASEAGAKLLKSSMSSAVCAART